MDDQFRTVYEALLRLHPPLAGLYQTGVEYATSEPTPARTHLLAHIGREVSRHLLRIIAEELPTEVPRPSEASMEEDDQGSREKMRLKIGACLGLDPEHDVVRNWYRIHRDLEGRAHVGDRPIDPDPTTVRETFRRLTSLAWARLAPYFDAEDVVAGILGRPPERGDLESLQSLFLRPQLRYRFFALCRDPAWVAFLHEKGFFAHPPQGSPEEAATGRFTPWPEGTALVNVAVQAPALVVEIINASVASNNVNPLVWDQICRVAELIPVAHAPALASKVIAALKMVKPRMGGVAALRLANDLADGHTDKAIAIAKAMLLLKPLTPIDSEDIYRRVSSPTYELLESVDDYYIEKLFQNAVPLMGLRKPLATFEMLVDRLARAELLLEEAGYRDAPLSHHWLADWRSSRSGHDDLRADIAIAADRVASAAMTEDPSAFGRFVNVLGGRDSPVMKRLRLRLIIAAGPTGAADRIDEVLSDPETTNPEFGAREIAELLRKFFATASPEAREAFVQNLRAGPPEDHIISWIEWNGETVDDTSARQRATAAWLGRRLRWFHNGLPGDLTPLAASIGFTPGAFDRERQDLDEVGHSSGGISWGGDGSPKTVEELGSMDPVDLVEYLVAWAPDPNERFDGPNRRGLAERLRQLLAGEWPGTSALLGELARNVEAVPQYMPAALNGIHAHLKGNEVASPPWHETFELIRVCLRIAPRDDHLEIRRESLRVLREICVSKCLPSKYLAVAVSLTGVAVHTSVDWSIADAREYPDLDAVISGGLSQEAGEVVDLIFTIDGAVRAQGDAVHEAADRRLSEWLDAVVARTDVSAPAALVRIGAHLPWAIHVIPQWAQANEQLLFANGMRDPVHSSAWAGYLMSSRLYDSTFNVLRPWYEKHARDIEALIEWEHQGGAKGDSRISRAFVLHTGLAFLRGLARLHESSSEDLRRVFQLASPVDRDHFYWLVMRGLSDEGDKLQVGYLDRLTEFWEWRLATLEAAGAAGDPVESDALGWLILIPQLEPRAILGLAHRTLSLVPGARKIRRQVWKRLVEFVELDPAKGADMASVLVEAELGDPYPYLDVNELGPALRAIRRSVDPAVAGRGIDLINRIGGKGWSEFRQLLD